MGWFHSQNLNERSDGTCGSMLREGRCWWRPWWNETDCYRGPEFRFEWHLLTHFFHVGVSFGDDENDVQFRFACGLFAFWFTISNLKWKWLPKDRECEIAYHNAALWIHPWSKSMEWCRDDPWWVRGLTIHMPWDWTRVRHQVLRPDGSLADFIGSWERDKGNDGRYSEQASYRYTLKNGEIQNRIATIYVEEREWRWRWLARLPWPRKIRRSLMVDFDGEVGERTGSWKGGCTGCGYDLRPGEQPLDCLRRMEQERTFS